MVVSDPAAPPPVFYDPARRSRLASAFPKIAADLNAARETHKIPGLAAGVVVDGELVWADGFGVRNIESGAPVTPATVFRIGSLTKTFTAASAIILRDRGTLEFDRPAATYLPALDELVYPGHDARKLTVRDLLTHTSGLPRLGDFDYTDPERPLTRNAILESLAGFKLEDEPGGARLYSNLGFQLVGLLIEDVTGERYREYVSKNLLVPLGMGASAWDASDVPPEALATPYAPKDGSIVPQEHWPLAAGEAAGGLYSSVEDLARYAAFQLNAWPARPDPDNGVLKRVSLRESHRAQVLGELSVRVRQSQVSPSVTARVGAQGLGWVVEESCRFDHIVWHNGGTAGYKSALYMLPRRGVAVVTLANLAGAPLDELARGMLVSLHETGALEPRRRRPGPDLERQVGDLVDLYEQWDAEAYQRLFTDELRAEATAARLQEAFRGFRAEVGSCREHRPDEIYNPRWGRFVVNCERGELEVDVEVTRSDDARIFDMNVVILGGPVAPRSSTPPETHCYCSSAGTRTRFLACLRLRSGPMVFASLCPALPENMAYARSGTFERTAGRLQSFT